MSVVTLPATTDVRDAPASAVAALGITDLTELMRSVNQVTEALQQTHVQLQRQVARLQTELAEANAQLRRSRTLASLGEMAAGIAHEVRNPLASIQLYVQLLQDDLREEPGHVELCGKINRAVAGVDAIVRDVLMFAREARIHPLATTASELLDRALCECEVQVADGHVTVIHGDSRPSLRLEADVGLIVQALANVICNAVQAMVEAESPRRELRLEASRQNRRGPDGCRAPRIVLSVTDSGPGVDPAIVDRMFNPFFTTRKAGTGLGLAIVHRIVDAHGGSVSVRNEPGLGARIDICLPPSRAEHPKFARGISGDEFAAQDSAQHGADHSALITQHSSLSTHHSTPSTHSVEPRHDQNPHRR